MEPHSTVYCINSNGTSKKKLILIIKKSEDTYIHFYFVQPECLCCQINQQTGQCRSVNKIGVPLKKRGLYGQLYITTFPCSHNNQASLFTCNETFIIQNWTQSFSSNQGFSIGLTMCYIVVRQCFNQSTCRSRQRRASHQDDARKLAENRIVFKS